MERKVENVLSMVLEGIVGREGAERSCWSVLERRMVIAIEVRMSSNLDGLL